MNRKWYVLAALLFALVASLMLGRLSTNYIRSPNQVAADAAPVPRTLLTAQVRRGPLKQNVSGAGSVDLGGVMTLDPAPPMSGSRSILTERPPDVGSAVSAGNVVVEIADRPVIVLAGAVPLVRDLIVGDSGNDVYRLQESLRSAGFPVYDESGFFGQSTGAAIEALYRRDGYSPPTKLVSSASPAPSGAPANSGDESSGQTPVVTASMAEIVMAPHLPATVVKVNGVLGGQTVSPVATLASASPTVRLDFNPLDAASIKVGDNVSLQSQESGAPLGTARVVRIGTPGPGADGSVTVPIAAVPKKALRLDQVGKTVIGVVSSNLGSSQDVIVPISSLVTADTGETSVVLVDGEQRTVMLVKVLNATESVALIESSSASRRIPFGSTVEVGLQGDG